MVRNWNFKIQGSIGAIQVFTTRPDTLFGVTFMTLAPEHELLEKITSPACKKAVEQYINEANKRSERERMTDLKKYFRGIYRGLCGSSIY